MLLAHRTAWAAAWLCTASLAMGSDVSLAGTTTCHTHTAVAGDTLIGLSQHYLAQPMQWQLLARANRVPDPRRIPIGTRLCIPVDQMKSTPKSGVVLEVVGEATAKSGDKTTQAGAGRAVQKGDPVPPGMSLRTSPNGYVTVQLADGSILKIQANTEAKLESSQHYEEAGFYASVWSVLRGRVESLVTHLTGGQPRYQIKTPQAVLGVRGTEFRVATDGRRTLGETLTGTVAVSSGQQTALINAGQGTIADAQNKVAPPLPLPSAPPLDGLPKLFERPLLRIDLPSVPGASSYRLQIAEDADFRRVRAELTDTQTHFRISDLPDGRYHLRMRVANAQGLEGRDAVATFQLKARPEPPIPTAPGHQAKLRAREATLNWTSHPQATRYRVQIARDALFTQLVAEQTDLRDTHWQTPLPAGDYFWRLATTGAGPDLGPWGDAQMLLMREPPAQPSPPTLTPDALQFSLQAEPGQRFEFQMARDEAFADLIKELPSDKPEVSLPRPVEGGRLFVRYRAIDSDGFIGPYTAPQLVLLPACLRDGHGSCVQGDQRFITTRP